MAQVYQSNQSVFAVDPDEAVWGVDAQEQWVKLASETLIREGNRVLLPNPGVVDEILHEPLLYTSAPEGQFLGSDGGLIPLQVDPPEHRRYRKLLDPLFHPKIVARLEDKVASLANELIDGFADSGSCNFSRDFAEPLPVSIFLALLGLPVDQLPTLVQMKNNIIRPVGDTEAERTAIRAETGQAVGGFFYAALDERVARPTDDLLGHIAGLENAGELTRAEGVNICFLLMIAGLDTVTDVLQCSFAYLAMHPDHRHQIVAEPDLIPSAVEELLRWESPVPVVTRFVAQDTETNGCPIHKGESVVALLAGINHSTRAVDTPDVVDFTRQSNRHVAFGAGVHRCLGSHLARAELRIALREWHRRIPDYHLPADYVLRYSPGLREIQDLQLQFGDLPR